MTSLEQYIHSYFGVVEVDDIKSISTFFKSTTIKKGDYYLESGKWCNQLSFVQSGMLRIFVNMGDKEITQWITTPGYFITDLSSFVYQVPSRWNIQALVDTEVYTIMREDYQNLGNIIPSWNELEKLFLVKCFTMMEERIFSHLSMTAEERYQYFFYNNKELFNQVPLQYIASMLGMTPETFSRIRKKQLL
jgi:CRP-like cAMP-binding protein